jgi:hypothetical protein
MLYKVVIQKPVPGKSHPTEEQKRRHQRVVVVSDDVVRRNRIAALEAAGVLEGTTGEIVSVSPAGDVVVLAQ